MNAMQQVTDNLAYADRARPGMLTAEDHAMFRQAKTVYDTMALVCLLYTSMGIEVVD